MTMTTETPQSAQKTILLLSLADLFSDTRTNRIIRLLQPHYTVIATGIKKPHVPGVRFIAGTHTPMDLKSKVRAMLHLATRQYEAYYWRRTILHDLDKKLTDIRPDLVLVCDIEMLPSGLKLARERGVPVLCDTPDYPPQRTATTRNEAVLYPPAYWDYLCRTYLPRTDGVITSSEGMARLYERTLGIVPHVFTNAPDYVDISPSLRAEDEPRIRLVFRGEAVPFYQHNHEVLPHLATMLDERFELDMLMTTRGPPHRAYGKTLEQRIEGGAQIRFYPTPALQPLFLSTRQHDIALWLHTPHNDNQRFWLPETVFDYVQARLAVVTTPQQPDVAALVQACGCGVGIGEHSLSLRSLADTLMRLDHRAINAWKQQAHSRARALSVESTRDDFLHLVEQMIR